MIKTLMENWRKYVKKGEPLKEAGNPAWNGMSIGRLGDGKFVAIAADGGVLQLSDGSLAIFDSREKAVEFIQSKMSD